MDGQADGQHPSRYTLHLSDGWIDKWIAGLHPTNMGFAAHSPMNEKIYTSPLSLVRPAGQHTCDTRTQDISTDSCHHQDAQVSCKMSVNHWGKKLRHQASRQKAYVNPYYGDTQEILQQGQVLYRNRKILGC